ncbi:hypothetical protein DYB25_004363 [Aphanomyces astaci]|uniref:Alpha/beta hydrolase fold-3 domain-containing protein n=2 Tax=Aphanomyces astaci TaxID=112090 RepID=A0A397EC09_APHAT|nr:hypothetical protein DYB25_004363 [Aphanomyces astaci]RHY66397.1 hypothetical protein DYB38_001879 [Aphanomyces astaci]RHY76554.1 hypothetical protein DYB30_010864 [Aphanomyces astaci]
MDGFFWQMLTGEYAHLLVVGNVVGMATWLRRLSNRKCSQITTWQDAGLVSAHAFLIGRLVQLAVANFGSAAYFRRAFVDSGVLSSADAKSRIGNRSWSDWWSLWNPLPFSLRFPGSIKTVAYGWVGERLPHALQMDVYRHENCGEMPPVLLFIHGGGWLLGSKATIPSTLTFQPGFENADCSVLACVDAYGTHDLTDRFGHYGRIDVAYVASSSFYKKSRYYVEAVLMNTRLCVNRPAFERASPLYHVLQHTPSSVVPPFLCVHGIFDSVIPIEDTCEFFHALQRHRQVTGRVNAVPDVFVPLPQADHAFNCIRSPRTVAYNDAVGVFLDLVLAAHTKQHAVLLTTSKL